MRCKRDNLGKDELPSVSVRFRAVRNVAVVPQQQTEEAGVYSEQRMEAGS